jgi:uncharacterized protein involved in exopolysaccharide biosynthesis
VAEIPRYQTSAVAEFMKDKSHVTTISIVDPAVPAERKSRPKTGLNMMLAGILSLFIGMLIAVFLEHLSKQKSA